MSVIIDAVARMPGRCVLGALAWAARLVTFRSQRGVRVVEIRLDGSVKIIIRDRTLQSVRPPGRLGRRHGDNDLVP
jgi:hypothetical protein